MKEIYENAKSIRNTLEEACTKWDLQWTRRSSGRKCFNKHDDKSKASTLTLTIEILGFYKPPSIENLYTYTTSDPTNYPHCGMRHLKSQCEAMKTDQILKKHVGTYPSRAWGVPR